MGAYNINIKQSGAHATSVVGDRAQVISNSHSAPSAKELLTLLKAIRQEIDQMELPVEAKDEARSEVGRAIVQANEAEPDTSKLVERLKKAAEIVKNSSSIALGMTKFWVLVKKAIVWLM